MGPAVPAAAPLWLEVGVAGSTETVPNPGSQAREKDDMKRRYGQA